MSKKRPRRSRPLGQSSTTAWANAKYDREQRMARSGRMPITLIDASSAANIARDLAVLAASFHARRPCYSQLLQRAAQQVADAYTPAAAVINYTTKPAASSSVTEATATERTATEMTAAESTLTGA